MDSAVAFNLIVRAKDKTIIRANRDARQKRRALMTVYYVSFLLSISEIIFYIELLRNV